MLSVRLRQLWGSLGLPLPVPVPVATAPSPPAPRTPSPVGCPLPACPPRRLPLPPAAARHGQRQHLPQREAFWSRLDLFVCVFVAGAPWDGIRDGAATCNMPGATPGPPAQHHLRSGACPETSVTWRKRVAVQLLVGFFPLFADFTFGRVVIFKHSAGPPVSQKPVFFIYDAIAELLLGFYNL